MQHRSISQSLLYQIFPEYVRIWYSSKRKSELTNFAGVTFM